MRSDIPVLIFFAVFVSFIGIFIYRIVRFDGYKAAMFGSCIDRTVGEVKGTGKMGNIRLRVHALARADEDKAVGIELVATTIGSYQMLPITLSVQGARDLVDLVQEAASDATQIT